MPPSLGFPAWLRLCASGGDVSVDPAAWGRECEQYEQDTEPIATRSKGRLAIARIIENQMARIHLGPRKHYDENAGAKKP
jgi:hypothetical protein